VTSLLSALEVLLSLFVGIFIEVRSTFTNELIYYKRLVCLQGDLLRARTSSWVSEKPTKHSVMFHDWGLETITATSWPMTNGTRKVHRNRRTIGDTLNLGQRRVKQLVAPGDMRFVALSQHASRLCSPASYLNKKASVQAIYDLSAGYCLAL